MLSRAELEQSYRSLVGLHKGGGLSEPGLIDALVILAVEFAAGDDPEITARRRRLIDGEQSYRKVTAAGGDGDPVAAAVCAGHAR